MGMQPRTLIEQRGYGYLAAVAGTAVITAILAPFSARLSSTTVALALLLVVLFIATLWGSKPALLGSALAVLCFNFFFLPPVGTFTIENPQNWVALAAFLVTAVTAGELSARAKRRAEEAEDGRREIKRLYDELRDAFERASHAEALRESERLKSALLEAVTHDLRTPLTSIKAAVTSLLSHARGGTALRLDEEGQREFLEVVNEETDRLDRFVESLVELARIQAGEMRLRRRWVAVEEIVDAALSRAEPLARSHRVEVNIEPELPVVHADAGAISEVVYNLIDNATKYSPAGSRILIEARSAPSEMVEIRVSDEGAGVPEELRAKVFDKFFRAHAERQTASRRPAGIGLGLSIARGIVEAHSGSIWIEDAAGGRGASVVFTLPIGDEDSAAIGEEPAAADNVDSASRALTTRHE